MKVVLDCNVFISSGIKNGLSRIVFEYIITHCEVYASRDIIEEYIEVINRNKFKRWKEFFNLQLALFIKSIKIINPKKTKIKIPDKDDIIYLSLALEVKAKYIITGNVKDFPDLKYENTKIITPREFYDKYIAQ